MTGWSEKADMCLIFRGRRRREEAWTGGVENGFVGWVKEDKSGGVVLLEGTDNCLIVG